MTDNFASHPRIKNFWVEQQQKIDEMTTAEYRQLTKTQVLPLARIKKIMKIDEEVKTQMISSEGPILIAKACEFLIEELTLRAWLNAEHNRRKTLQKIDISHATVQSEMFDFLIDIVPRPDQKETSDPILICPRPSSGSALAKAEDNTEVAEPVQYVLQYSDDQGNGDGNHSFPYIVQCDGASYSNGSSLIPLGNGSYVEAMEIGPSIPLNGSGGQQIQVVTMQNGTQIKFSPIASSDG